MPARPSIRAWDTLTRTVVAPAESGSSSTICQSGRAMSRASSAIDSASSSTCRTPPGAATLLRRRW